VDESKVA